MPYVTTQDGTQIFYKDWGAAGSPVLLSHGWPLNSDAWEAAALFLAMHGHRVIAHDRRGHGKSTQSWAGNDMDTYADDLASLIDHLDLANLTLVGHSTGGGEVAHYVARHGSARVSKLVLVSAVPPLMLRTDDNPAGLPIDVFDGLRAGEASNRSQLYRDLADGPLVLGVGSEGDGLSRLVAETCDQLVSIPMANSLESLNAGVAASVALYAIAEARRVGARL